MSTGEQPSTVWERLREYTLTQTGTFSSQEAISWFAPHYPGTNDSTLRTHLRNASWNVANRDWAAEREPLLTRVEHGLFRRISPDDLDRWRVAHPTVAPVPPHTAPDDAAGQEWHSETYTQRLLVAWLEREGWTILRTADTARREHGIDVVAERAGERLGCEVKGYPSIFYVTGPKKGLPKATKPNAQAPKWYAHALVPAMRLRATEPATRSIMCFPDFPIYRALHADTASSLRAAGIEVWVVTEDGDVTALR